MLFDMLVMSPIRNGIARTKQKMEKIFPNKGGSKKAKRFRMDPSNSVYTG